MEQVKQKKHRGWIAPVVILAILLLLVGGFYAYLAIGASGVSKQHAAADADGVYTGEVTYLADGNVSFLLTENDLYRAANELLDISVISEELPLEAYGVTIEDYALSLSEEGATISVAAKYKGFLPIPIQALVIPHAKGKTVTIEIVEARLGSLIRVPAESLASYGVETELTFELGDTKYGDKLKSIAFEDDGVRLEQTFLNALCLDTQANAHRTVLGLWLYEGDAGLADDPMKQVIIKRVTEEAGRGVTALAMVEAFAASKDPRGMMTRLLACCDEEMVRQVREALEPLERMCVLNQTDAEIDAVRKEYNARINVPQKALETMLTNLRDMHKKHETMLSGRGMLNLETKELISFTELADKLPIADETTQTVMLYSNDARISVRTSDMPWLKAVAREEGAILKTRYELIPYDVGILTLLPCQRYAVIYYQANDQFIIHLLFDDEAGYYLSAKQPLFLLSDSIPMPPTRTVYSTPESGMSDYIVLIPLESAR